MEKPIIVDDWPNGITEDLTTGLNLVKNASVHNINGMILPTYISSSLFPTGGATTFTVNTSTNICTLGSSATFAGANTTAVAVTVSTTGSLPSGLSANTIYFVITTNVGAGTFQLATSVANANASTAITISTTGTGVQTITPYGLGGITASVSTPQNQIFFLNSTGDLWCLDNGAAALYLVLAPATDNYSKSKGGLYGQGLNVFTNSNSSKTQLFIFRDVSIDLLNVTSGSTYTQDPVGQGAWSYSWTGTSILTSTIATSAGHNCYYWSQSNYLYFCNASYVGSFQEIGIFNPWIDGTGAGTFTLQTTALALPHTDNATWIDSLGSQVYIAGLNSTNIYPWDGAANSFTKPLVCGETGIYFIKNINGIVYILAGDKGNIYSTNGYYVSFVTRVPEFLTNGIASWTAIGAEFGHLLFSFSSTGSYNGLWRLTPEGIMTLDNTSSSGAGGIGTILTKFDQIYFGGAVNNYVGVDVTSKTVRQGQYNSVVQSGLYMIGTRTKPEKISYIEIQLASPTGNDTIRVSYRRNTAASWTTWVVFTMNGTSTSFTNDSNGLINVENMQFQIEFGGAVQLLIMRLFP